MQDGPPPRDVLRIRQLNDQFRTTLSGGAVVMTIGVQSLSVEAQTEVLKAVVTFNDFNPANDPHGEHDFGAFEIDGQKIFFKVDYYDIHQKYGSPDPANPEVTSRVMTILLAEEY